MFWNRNYFWASYPQSWIKAVIKYVINLYRMIFQFISLSVHMHVSSSPASYIKNSISLFNIMLQVGYIHNRAFDFFQNLSDLNIWRQKSCTWPKKQIGIFLSSIGCQIKLHRAKNEIHQPNIANRPNLMALQLSRAEP